MGKLTGCFFILLFMFLQAVPLELTAQDFLPRLFRTGKYTHFSCRKMEAYNQRAAYRKYKKRSQSRLVAKTTKKVEPNATVRNTKTTKTTNPPQTNVTATTKTKNPSPTPSDTPSGTKPVPTTNVAPPVAKIKPTKPGVSDSTGMVKINPPMLTQQMLKKMTIEERRDTLQKTPPTIVLPPIQFVSDQDEFSVVNMDSFMQAMEYAQQGKVVLIEGHTDDLGSNDYNLKLSMKRAEKIRQLLLSGDVSDELISVIGYGEEQPVVPNTSTENRAVNRRIEFKIFSLSE
jgi:outer membrane protein OmpA-like peptidoglycan-associated protein